MRLLIFLTLMTAICACGNDKGSQPAGQPAAAQAGNRERTPTTRNSQFCHEVALCKSMCKRFYHFQDEQEIRDYYSSIGAYGSQAMYDAIDDNDDSIVLFNSCLNMAPEDVLH